MRMVALDKHLILLVVEYETAGGHGEHDAIEEGLQGMLENPDNPTVFEVKVFRSITPEEMKQVERTLEEE